MSNLDTYAGSQPEETGLGRPVSRRFFFSLTAVVGALAFQGSALGGRIVAYADEAGHSHFSVYILSKYEVPVVVADETGSAPVILSGAKVTLRSHVTGETVSGVTRDDGFVPLNVKALSYQKDHDESSKFNFWGSVEMEKDGYQSYYAENCFVEAGTPPDEKGNRTNTVHIETKADDGKPYLRSFMLDGADILYEDKAGCAVWSGNTMDHEIVVQVVAKAAGKKVSAALLLNGKEVAKQDVVAESAAPYIATAKFTDKWLQKFQIGDKLGVAFEVDGVEAEVTSPLQFIEPILLSEQGSTTILTSPGASSDEKKDEPYIPMPKWLNRKGDSASLEFPMMPFTLFFDSDGGFGMTADLLQINFVKRKNGKSELKEDERIQSFKGRSGKDAWENYKNDMLDALLNYADAVEDSYEGGRKHPKLGKTKITKTVDVKFNFLLRGVGKTLKDKSGTLHTTGDLVLIPQLSAAFAMTQQVAIGYFPMFWTFDLSAELAAKIFLGLEFDGLFKKVQWGHNSGTSIPGIPNAVVTLDLEAGLSLGIGIQGILSAAIRGYGSLNFEFDFTYKKNETFPHIVISLGGGVQVIAQALFFTKKVTIVNSEPPVTFFDSNKKKSLPAGAGEAEPYQTYKFEAADAVTDSDLSGSVEAQGAWASSNDELDGYMPIYDAITAPSLALNLADASFVDPEKANDSNYNPINGLHPTVQEKLWTGCFSNPRMRIVHTDTKSFKNDRAFMVRIATVNIEVPRSVDEFATGAWYANGQATNAFELGIQDIDGNHFVRPLEQVTNATNGTTVTRTRVTISEWNKSSYTWGEAHVVDFAADGEVYESDRLNSHDVDFDVELHDGAIYLAITSLKRPEKNGATFEDNLRNQYVSLVRWDIDKNRTVAAGSSASQLGTGKSLFHPRILMQHFDAEGRKDKLCAVVYSFVCTYDDDGDVDTCNVAATVYDDLTSGGLSNHRLSNPTNILSKEIQLDPQTLSEGTFEVSCPDRSMTVWDPESGRNQSTVVLSWSHPASETVAATSFVTSQTYSIVIDKGSSSSEHKPFVTQHDHLNLDQIPTMVKLGNMDQQGLFSFADVSSNANTKPMGMVTYDKKTLKLGHIPATGDTDKLNYFSSFNGRRLYTVRVMEGNLPSLSEDTLKSIENGGTLHAVKSPYNSPTAMRTKDSLKGGKVKLYQLLEARWVDELQTYYDFYPIAQLSVMPDNIGVISVTKTRTDFTFAVMRENEQNVSDIWQAAVPAITVGITGEASATCPFAAPGDECWYNVSVSNIGNTPITEVTMAITDKAGKEVSRKTFDNLAKYVQASTDNVRSVDNANGSDYEIVSDKRDTAGILWPGKTRTYRFNFTVPTGYEKDVDFYVSCVDAKDRMEDLSQFAEFHDAPAASNGEVPLISPADFVMGPDGEYIPSVVSDSPAGFSVNVDNGSNKEFLVDAADEPSTREDDSAPWGTLGVGAAALGLAAAALTAYSNRRVENEKGEEEQQE